MHFRMIAFVVAGALLLVGCAAQETATTTTGTSRPTTPASGAPAKGTAEPTEKLCNQVNDMVAGIVAAKKAIGSADTVANAKIVKALRQAGTNLTKAAPKLKADITTVVDDLAAQLGVPPAVPGTATTVAQPPGSVVAAADWTKARDHINAFRAANCFKK